MSEPQSYKPDEILIIAINGGEIDLIRAMATFADPENWRQVYQNSYCEWCWQGPNRPPYELAQWALKDKEDRDE